MSNDDIGDKLNLKKDAVNRRAILLGSTTFAAASAIATGNPVQVAQAQQQPAAPSGKKPNILVIFGDDIGQSSSRPFRFGAKPLILLVPRRGFEPPLTHPSIV
jgi:hypothetical protein